MAKRKPRSTIMVGDGAGGLAQVVDRRFERLEDWPIRFEVPYEQADKWLRYLAAECSRRGWSTSSFGQIERAENSGNVTVRTGPEKPQLAVVWERKWDRKRNAGGNLAVWVRSIGAPEFVLAEAQQFFEQISERCRLGVTDRVYRRGDLQYEGLPWRGELWLDDTLRLGPPARQDDSTARNRPRIVHADIMLECIGPDEAPWALRQLLDELSAFLSVIMGKYIRRADQGWAWTYMAGLEDCEVRSIGYLSPRNPMEMPAHGVEPSMPLRPVARPDLSRGGDDITITPDEQWLPADMADLWRLYRALPSDRRRQFLKAAAKFQESCMLPGDVQRPTLSFALMVVACEALKPPEREFRDYNHYHVVEALLGEAVRQRLQQHPFPAEQVRNAHLHVGEFHGAEFVELALLSSYEDPSFREAYFELFKISRSAIIEWLRLRGIFTLPPPRPKRRTLWRWIKDHAAIVITVVGVIGVCLGWLARALWAG